MCLGSPSPAAAVWSVVPDVVILMGGAWLVKGGFTCAPPSKSVEYVADRPYVKQPHPPAMSFLLK